MVDNKVLAEKSILIHLKYYRIKNEMGKELDYSSHYFLVDMLLDMSPNQVWMKAAQLGLSTLEIIKTLFCCKTKGWDIIYTLPTSDFAAEFVSSKVNRIIQTNPIYQEWTKDKDSVEQKQIGKNMIYYRGAQISKQAISVSADLVVNDEVDRSDQGVISQYETRLQHSDFKGKWLFSNPSLEGNGVSRYWKEADQKHWFIKCPHCSKEQYLDYPESFDMDNEIYICKHCKGELDNETRRNGRWIAKFKDRKWSGYWVPLFIAPWVSAKEIIEKERTMSRDVFYNFVLGKPFIDNNATITPDLIYRNLVKSVDRKQPMIIGCDSGILKHYVKGNVNGIWDYGVTERWEDIEKMLLENPEAIAFIDAMPDITGPRALKEKFEGRVFLCTFGGDRDVMGLFDFKQGSDYGLVRIERNRTVQNVVGELVDGRISFEGDDRKWKEYVSHWLTMYRVIEKGANEREKMIWKSTNGKDHYCFATFLWRAGVEKFRTTDMQIFVNKNNSVEDLIGLQNGEEGVIMG